MDEHKFEDTKKLIMSFSEEQLKSLKDIITFELQKSSKKSSSKSDSYDVNILQFYVILSSIVREKTLKDCLDFHTFRKSKNTKTDYKKLKETYKALIAWGKKGLRTKKLTKEQTRNLFILFALTSVKAFEQIGICVSIRSLCSSGFTVFPQQINKDYPKYLEMGLFNFVVSSLDYHTSKPGGVFFDIG